MIPRYESAAIREIWSEAATFARWTRIEIAACEAWHAAGLLGDADLGVIRALEPPSPERVREIEKTTDHDVVAFVRALTEAAGESARHVHRGLTSSDVVDTALALAIAPSLDVLMQAAVGLREALARRAREHKHTPCVGRTHGVHAEPTTYGLRLLGFVCEVDRHLERLRRARATIAFGKLSGAVGNFSQIDPGFESFVMERLGLSPEPVATQVVPRDRHAEVLTALAILGGGLERIATDVRALQRTDLREAEEPFKPGQTGSSAMPHKRNPIVSERVCGMARLLRGYAMAALEDIALWHERDISHSSVERVMLPDAFHLAHTMLTLLTRVFDGLRVYPDAMRANLGRTRGMVFSQNVLSALIAAGMDRQEAYTLVQAAAAKVWEGQSADLKTALAADAQVSKHLDARALERAFSLDTYTRHLDALFERAGLE